MGFLSGLLRAILHGVSPALLKKALGLVAQAAVLFADNAERREWAVKELIQHGLSESLARFLVELAVRLVKKA